jgi:hypothetical protein
VAAGLSFCCQRVYRLASVQLPHRRSGRTIEGK